MKLRYLLSGKDKEYLDTLKNGDTFQQACYHIQDIWLRIHACRKELTELYIKQAGLKKEEDCDWGICINDWTCIPSQLFDCSVGQVRKMRHHVPDSVDDGRCNTCPYFVTKDLIRTLI